MNAKKPCPRLLFALAALTLGAADPDCANQQPLSTEDRQAGWVLLSGPEAKPLWTGGIGVPRPDAAWRFDDACIHLANPSIEGSLYSARNYNNFELEFEWKISKAGNSGVKYAPVAGLLIPPTVILTAIVAPALILVALLWAIHARRSFFARTWPRRTGYAFSLLITCWLSMIGFQIIKAYNWVQHHPRGLEFQMTDDLENPDAKSSPTRKTAALYDLFSPTLPITAKPLEFHRSRITVRGNQVEHWYEDQKVLEFSFSSPELRKAIAQTKFSAIAEIADKHAGPLEFQNHENEVWFRNVRIRELP